MTDEVRVDARGHRCPVPTLRLKRMLDRTVAGGLVRLLADDPMVRIDVPHFAAVAGVEVVSLETDGDTISILVRKAPPGVGDDLARQVRRAVGDDGAPPG